MPITGALSCRRRRRSVHPHLIAMRMPLRERGQMSRRGGGQRRSTSALRAQKDERKFQMVTVFRSTSTAAKRRAPPDRGVSAIPNAAPRAPLSS